MAVSFRLPGSDSRDHRTAHYAPRTRRIKRPGAPAFLYPRQGRVYYQTDRRETRPWDSTRLAAQVGELDEQTRLQIRGAGG